MTVETSERDTGVEASAQKLEDKKHDITQAAWVDEDDEPSQVNLASQSRTKKLRTSTAETLVSGKEYTQRLRNQFEKFHPRPNWATTRSDDEDEVESIFQNPSALLKTQSSQDRPRLPPDVIGLRRYRNANFSQSSSGGIVAIDFHPSKPWILVASKNRKLDVYEVDGIGNKCLFSLKVDGFDISDAKYSADGKVVLITGSSPGFIVWDIMQGRVDKHGMISGRKEKAWSSIQFSRCGRFIALKGKGGSVVVLSAKTYLVQGTIQMGAEVFGFVFSIDGSAIYSVGADCKVYIWETSRFQCVNVIPEESGTICTSVAVSPDGMYLSVGSNLGIVSLYELSNISNLECRTLKPIKTFMNLTTSISHIIFHPSSEVMLFASKEQRNAVRIVHIRSGRVYSNWPKTQTPIFRAHSISIDPSGKLLSIGNDKGHVLVYGLRHYE